MSRLPTMRSKFPVAFILLVGLVYVGFGDQFLPPAIGRSSFQIRATINNALVGMFPSWRPKTNPNQRTEDAVQNLEQRKPRN